MVLSSNFFPCTAYFSKILPESSLYFNLTERYQKQSYATRAYILGPHKIETLNVPVLKYSNNALLKDIKISYQEDWIRKNEKTLKNCYAKSPYFEHLFYLFDSEIKKRPAYLVDLNQKTLEVCLKILGLNPTFCHKEYAYFENKDNFISFNSKNRHEIVPDYVPKSYFQTFGNMFEPNLSILDLLFNSGTDAKSVLKESIAY
jgi:hypothetical protein